MPAFIDFARLRPPEAIEALDYEAQLDAAQAKLTELLPEWDVANIESDPANKVLEVAAYLDLLLRGRVNDAVKSMLLAYAEGGNLDQLGVNINVARLDGESDARFRARVQQGLWAYTAVGNPGAYRYHAMSVGTDVLDARPTMPTPGRVDVVTFARKWGEASDATDHDRRIATALFGHEALPYKDVPVIEAQDDPLLSAVREILTSDDVAPLTDDVHVLPPTPVEVPVTATLHLEPGPDAAAVLADSLAALRAYQLQIRRIGYDCTRAGIIDALVVSGVRAVELTAPAADVIVGDYGVAAMTPVTVTVDGVRSV